LDGGIGAFELEGAFNSGGDEAEADVHYTATTMAGLDKVDSDRGQEPSPGRALEYQPPTG